MNPRHTATTKCPVGLRVRFEVASRKPSPALEHNTLLDCAQVLRLRLDTIIAIQFGRANAQHTQL